mmetsp:Transcript_12814/g.53699  ORF Transcript_12814/g.53699 Transcript_12814/m.53699 type:complete len:342 (+) Transcript_12814:1806-2831(+)
MYIFCPSMPFTRSVERDETWGSCASSGGRSRVESSSTPSAEERNPSRSRSARKHPRATVVSRTVCVCAGADPTLPPRIAAPTLSRTCTTAPSRTTTRGSFSRNETSFRFRFGSGSFFISRKNCPLVSLDAFPSSRAPPPVNATKASAGAPFSRLLSTSLKGTPLGCASLYSYGKKPSTRSRTYDRFVSSANDRNVLGASSTTKPSRNRVRVFAFGASSLRSPFAPTTTELFPSPATALSSAMDARSFSTSTAKTEKVSVVVAFVAATRPGIAGAFALAPVGPTTASAECLFARAASARAFSLLDCTFLPRRAPKSSSGPVSSPRAPTEASAELSSPTHVMP